jgi:hypothetical protein
MARSARDVVSDFCPGTWVIVTAAIDLLARYAGASMWRLSKTAGEAINRGLRIMLIEQKRQWPSCYAVYSAACMIGRQVHDDCQLAEIASLCDDIVLLSLLRSMP